MTIVRALVLWLILAGVASAGETVDVVVPPSIDVKVSDVSQASDTEVATLSFSKARLTPGHALRISVKAEAPAYTPPPGSHRGTIPATNLSWTTSNALNGTGFNGTVSATTYTQVYQSVASPTTGSVNLTWKLSAPGARIHARVHTLGLTWKVESVP